MGPTAVFVDLVVLVGLSIGPWSWPSGLFPFGPVSPRSLAPGPPAVHGPWEVPVSTGVVLVVFLKPPSCDMILLHRVYEVHVVQLCLVCHVT